MKYKVIDIEGVGQEYAKALQFAGVFTVDELLQRCRTPRSREELAAATDISGKLILRWANMADLFRIKGVGPQFAELLEASGVDTVKEFRHRKADNLAAKMAETNEQRKLTRRVPTEAMLARMIDQAKTLEPAIEY